MNVDANVKCVQEHFTAKRISPRVRKMDPAGRNRTKTQPRMSGVALGQKLLQLVPTVSRAGKEPPHPEIAPCHGVHGDCGRGVCWIAIQICGAAQRLTDLASHRRVDCPPGCHAAWLSCRDGQPTHISGDLVDAKLRAPWPRPGWRVLTTTTSQDRPSRPRSGNPRRPAGSAAPPSVPDWRSNAARTGP